ncbi:MAG: response regulator transcription factor [Candidatus Pacebacteria bacterium]|nr:response regulator transcription factor [Candidatus Paceibacterota bacterium]
MTILVVEDEKKLADLLKRALVGEHYTVEVANDGEEGLQKALKNNYSLIVLDLMLPKKDGMEICRELRARHVHTPIIILTARGILEDRVKGLDLGADDYLTKPFEMSELFARVRALLRRRKTTDSLILKAADLIMDTKAHEVTRAGKKISLTLKEYKILDTLLRKNGEAITRAQLINEAWGHDFKEDNHELNVHIRYLRSKIDEGHSKSLIQTVRGVGYILKE